MRREMEQHIVNARDADALAPRKRPERIVHALLHREIEIRARADALIHRLRRFVDEHRNGAHHGHAGDIFQWHHGIASLRQCAGCGSVGIVGALTRSRDRDALRGRVIEREIDQYDVVDVECVRAFGGGVFIG